MGTIIRGWVGRKKLLQFNLGRLDQYFEDGETINKQTLMDKGIPMRRMKGGFKVLSQGDLTKKVAKLN